MLKRETDAAPDGDAAGLGPTDQFRARGLMIRFQRDAGKKVIALTVDAGRVAGSSSYERLNEPTATVTKWHKGRRRSQKN